MKMKRMPGLLCRSEASTAVCIPSNPRPLTLPRRPCRTTIHLNHHNYASSRTRYYSRLVDDLDVQKRLHHTPLAASSKREKTQKAITALVDKNPPPPLAPSTLGDVFQVVVMRVSIHCQGCAGKVKKHISKMEGVTSFSIDLETKRVTVMGHISPDGVLESISKVKKAEFWYA